MEGKNNEELVRELIQSFSSLRDKMEDPDYLELENSVKELKESQDHLRKEISELKNKLLNPEDGIIVEMRQNTKFRKQEEARSEEYQQLINDHRDLLQWRNRFNKFFWIIFTTATGIISFVLTELLKRLNG